MFDVVNQETTHEDTQRPNGLTVMESLFVKCAGQSGPEVDPWGRFGLAGQAGRLRVSSRRTVRLLCTGWLPHDVL